MIERIRRLSVAIRSVLAFGVIGLVLLALGIFSLVEFKQVSDQITYITAQRIPSIELVNNIDREFLRVRVHTANVEAADTPALREGYLTKIADAKSNLIKNQQALSRIVSSPEAKSLLNDYEQLDRQYWVLHDRFLELIANNNEQAAKKLRRDKQLPLTAQISAQLDTFLTYQGQKVDEATQKADKVVSAASLAIVIAIVLTVVLVASFSILFTKSIVRPIRDALNIAKRISQKDLSKPIEVDGNDEISELIRQLSQTQESLRDSISAISHSAEQLATTSEQLSSVTNDASATIQNQSDEVDQASRSINELAKAVEAVAEDAQKASDSSDIASEKANLGGSKVHEAEIAIENLVSDMSISTDKVSELAVKVNDITKVLEVIRGIADQTNLLALNAAIEAARAGESGRGFSVVADEVRALAQRTQESTVEIEELVSIINKSSSDSVKTMQQSSNRANESLDIAKDAGAALKEIMRAVEEIKNRNASIASAAEEQATTSKVIDQNLVKVRDLASSTASGAEQSNVSASDLARLATSLNDMTVKFKL